MHQLDLTLVFEQKPPPLDFIFCGLAAGTVGNISGPGAIGKSFAALEMAMGVASAEAGSLLLGLAGDREGKVVMYNAEDPEDIIKNRLYSIGQILNTSARQQALANFEFYPLVGKQPNILNPQFISEVIKNCQGKRLVILDTFTRFHQLNENDNGQMSQVVSCYEKIATETGAAVLFLHHNSKGSVWSGQQISQQSTRGASAITNNCRWQGYMQPMTEEEEKQYGLKEGARLNFVKFGGNKENYGVATAELWFERAKDGVLLPSKRFSSANVPKAKPNLKIVEKKAGGSNDTII